MELKTEKELEKEIEDKVKANLIREIKRKYPKGFCYVCGRKSVTIHHLREHIVGKTKSKGKLNGEIPLCRRCHDVVERINSKNKVSKRIKEAKLEGYRKAKQEFNKKVKEFIKRLNKLKKPEFANTEFKQCWNDGFNCCLDELNKLAGAKLI